MCEFELGPGRLEGDVGELGKGEEDAWARAAPVSTRRETWEGSSPTSLWNLLEHGLERKDIPVARWLSPS